MNATHEIEIHLICEGHNGIVDTTGETLESAIAEILADWDVEAGHATYVLRQNDRTLAILSSKPSDADLIVITHLVGPARVETFSVEREGNANVITRVE